MRFAYIQNQIREYRTQKVRNAQNAYEIK